VEPRLAVLLGQRDAGGHLPAVRLRVEVVRVVKGEPELVRDQLADRRLADAGDAHDDDQHAQRV